jgi:cytochrome c oxidase subunit II
MKTNIRAVLIASVVAIVAIGATAGYVSAQAAPRAKVIKISAKRFDYSPGKLILKKGQRVVLELTSKDVVMGFNLPDFNVRGDMIPGKVTRVEFTPDKTGEFTFLCDIFCGSGHEEMHGRITVVG